LNCWIVPYIIAPYRNEAPDRPLRPVEIGIKKAKPTDALRSAKQWFFDNRNHTGCAQVLEETTTETGTDEDGTSSSVKTIPCAIGHDVLSQFSTAMEGAIAALGGVGASLFNVYPTAIMADHIAVACIHSKSAANNKDDHMNNLTCLNPPATHTCGYIKICYDTAKTAMHQWLLSMPHKREVIVKESADAQESIRQLKPSKLGDEELVVETISEWTAFFNNCIMGTDAAGVISYLTKKLNAIGIIAAYNPGNSDTGYSVIFSVYGPEQDRSPNIIREIRLINDYGAWEFETKGKILPFEDGAMYKNRLKKDRFPPELLLRYLNEYGIAFNDIGFYGPRNALFRVVADPSFNAGAFIRSALGGQGAVYGGN